MKIDRLIGILSVLMQTDHVTSAGLAERFEVSRRTILRDIDALNRAGIPIVSSQGQGGGISVMRGFRIDRTLLSSADMQAILSGLQSLDSVSETNRYRQLMEKLSAGESAAVLADHHIIIDLSSWDKSAAAEKIETIRGAIERRHLITFRYFSPNGESSRRIEPYHLVFQWSSWYVWGFCTVRQDYRLFKLSRMTELAVSDEECEAREIPIYSCDKLRHIRGGIRAEVRFDRSQKWRLIDEFGAELLNYDENGDILLSLTWEDAPSLFRYILSFGDCAEIIAPEAYRKEFAEIVKRIFKRYET